MRWKRPSNQVQRVADICLAAPPSHGEGSLESCQEPSPVHGAPLPPLDAVRRRRRVLLMKTDDDPADDDPAAAAMGHPAARSLVRILLCALAASQRASLFQAPASAARPHTTSPRQAHEASPRGKSTRRHHQVRRRQPQPPPTHCALQPKMLYNICYSRSGNGLTTLNHQDR